MTGANSLLQDGNAMLTFKIGGGAKNRINRVRVQLNAADTYDVTFYKGSPLNIAVVAEVEGIYADQLAEVFTDATGFATSL
jgi:hypothetical protein